MFICKRCIFLDLLDSTFQSLFFLYSNLFLRACLFDLTNSLFAVQLGKSSLA